MLVATTILVATNPVLAKKSKDKGLGGPVGGYDTVFARGSEEARNAVGKLDNNQIKKIDADKSSPCPAVDNGNGYCEGFHDGWIQTVIGELD